jgi:Purine nucleoside phosphorylase
VSQPADIVSHPSEVGSAGARLPNLARADIGVIGGSGFYEFLESADEVSIDTPYGVPSDPIVTGEVAGRKVAFVPGTVVITFPPAQDPVPRQPVGAALAGRPADPGPDRRGLAQPRARPGRLAIPDQLVDRTTGRIQTFYEERGAVHVPFADPYCPVGRAQAITSARAAGWDLADSGTLVVIEGPRFSTRAESQWYAAQGWSLVGMTGHPEAVLARELALCYTAVALVTDTDAGVEEGEGVTQDEVFKVFASNVARLRELVIDVIANLPADRDCPCPRVLDGIKLPIQLP